MLESCTCEPRQGPPLWQWRVVGCKKNVVIQEKKYENKEKMSRKKEKIRKEWENRDEEEAWNNCKEDELKRRVYGVRSGKKH